MSLLDVISFFNNNTLVRDFGSNGDTAVTWKDPIIPNEEFVTNSSDVFDGTGVTKSNQLTTEIDSKDLSQNSVINATTESVKVLQDAVKTLLETTTYTDTTLPEVTYNKQDVTSRSGIGTAEKVVIGAALIVAILTVVAVILRIIGPCLRSKSSNSEEDKKIPTEGHPSKLSGFTNFGAELGSQSIDLSSSPSQDWSRSTGSTPISDWSEVSSETKTPSENTTASENQSASSGSESGTSMSRKHTPHNSCQLKPKLVTRDTLSVTSLPFYKDNDRLSSESSPGPMRRMTEEKLSTHSLEPLRLAENYRDRWDNEWDPHGYVSRDNLSYLSHPSESRLSLVSLGSMTSSSMTSLPPGKTTFPIPSREVVRQMHKDKERRYPSNTKVSTTTRKEKHVRLSPPIDRRATDH